MPGLALAHLLGAAVVVADVRHAVDDLLAVELQHDAQHAVRARVLRAEVQEHELGVVARARHAPLFGTNCSASCFGFLLLVGKRNGPISVARAGCSLRSGWPSQVGGIRMRRRCGWPSNLMPNMSQTSRSYQFAAGQRSVMVGSDERRAGERDLEADVLVAIEREQVVDDGEVARRLASRCAARARRWR